MNGARVLAPLAGATVIAALAPLAWGLVALGGAGLAVALGLREGDRRRGLPLILALLALGAVGAGMAGVELL